MKTKTILCFFIATFIILSASSYIIYKNSRNTVAASLNKGHETSSNVLTDLKKHVTDIEFELCSKESKLAGVLMSKRQDGESLEKHVDLIRSFNALSTSRKNHMIKIVTEAYNTPRYSTPEVKARSIKEYSNKIYKDCIQGMKENTWIIE